MGRFADVELTVRWKDAVIVDEKDYHWVGQTARSTVSDLVVATVVYSAAQSAAPSAVSKPVRLVAQLDDP